MGARLRLPFNRTTMELKQQPGDEAPDKPMITFNRTTMELKPSKRASVRSFSHTFNRTTMELKLGFGGGFFLPLSLLIEPLWN